ncbi:MAG: serine/threonine protein kinase [Myxacorys chilensis ATA2-1-KO14]|jgi:serine/threonine-protein kinase|nr:serine/threonine protein kinase [Myxacorys chilensis ATA2-1-KO14]
MVEHQLGDAFVKIVYAKVKSNGRTEMVPLKLYVDGSLEHITQSLFTSDSSVSPQTMLGDRYRVQRLLGQGGFGRTYLAADCHRFDELCVLKEFLPHRVGDYEIQKSRELFEQEAKILHQIEHPQIPKFLAYFEEDGRLFLVQEYIKGCTYSSLLRERHQRGEMFSEAEVVDWLHQLLPVLDYIHDRKIIHRDISPDNIMLHQDHNTPMLIDFGVGRWTLEQVQGAPSYSRKHSVVGKVGYAPHEQIWMGQCFPSSDLYSLAVTAVVLLTGKEPQTLMDSCSLEWQWRDHAQVSDRVAQVLGRMLNAKPTERYLSAQDVIAALNTLSSPSVTFVSQPLSDSVTNSVTIVSQSSPQAANAKHNDETFCSPIRANFSAPSLTAMFVQNCEQELMNCIGPIAKFLVQQALKNGNTSGRTTDRASNDATLTPEALVNALAEKIPNPNQAIEFRHRLLHF